jgi:hypothetical protein
VTARSRLPLLRATASSSARLAGELPTAGQRAFGCDPVTGGNAARVIDTDFATSALPEDFASASFRLAARVQHGACPLGTRRTHTPHAFARYLHHSDGRHGRLLRPGRGVRPRRKLRHCSPPTIETGSDPAARGRLKTPSSRCGTISSGGQQRPSPRPEF